MIQKGMKHVGNAGGGGGAVYGLGLIGAIIYFLQNTQGLGEILIGILKSIVWPAYFVFKIFEFLSV